MEPATAAPLIALHALHYGLVAFTTLGVLAVSGWRALPESARSATAALVGGARRGALDDRPTAVRWAAAATLGAAAIHGLVCPEHFGEGLRFGVFFLLLTAWQTTAAIALALGPWRYWLRPTALVNLLTVATWVLTRTVGLPLGLAGVEQVGGLDVTASILEFLSVVLCVVALRLYGATHSLAGQRDRKRS